MPIKPENKNRYPKNWGAISKDIRINRAKNACEVCGVKNYAVGVRNSKGEFCSVGGNVVMDLAAQGLVYPSLEPMTYKQAIELKTNYEESNQDDSPKAVIIILTVAHLDHTPENCDYSNLKAMCQKCHNDYDKNHRKANRQTTNKNKKGLLDLF